MMWKWLASQFAQYTPILYYVRVRTGVSIRRYYLRLSSLYEFHYVGCPPSHISTGTFAEEDGHIFSGPELVSYRRLSWLPRNANFRRHPSYTCDI